MIEGILNRLINSYDSEMNRQVEMSAEVDGKWSRAYIDFTYRGLCNDEDMSSALIASIFTNQDLTEKLKLQFDSWKHHMENDGIDKVTSNIVRLAVDGLWFNDIFGFSPMDDELKEKVYDRLNKTIEED